MRGRALAGDWLRYRLLAVLLLLAIGAVPERHVAASATTLVGPRLIYLALGDSVAWGYQPNHDPWHGYTDDLTSNFEQRGARQIRQEDLACQGENTDTFINGGCPYASINKVRYSGSQLQAALTSIHRYPGLVSPVTINIGPTDFAALIHSASCDQPALAGAVQRLAQFDANFTYILAQLQEALHGTGDLLTMNFYFPDGGSCPQLEPLVQAFNSHLAADAAQYGVPMADVFGAFGGFSAPNPDTCGYTWICTSYHDLHPNDNGYAAIARAFESAAGY
jgi:lysophospholipase L1-like esterase